MNNLSVYLAAPYGCRDSLRPLAAELNSIGMTVTSSWLEEQVEVSSDAATLWLVAHERQMPRPEAAS